MFLYFTTMRRCHFNYKGMLMNNDSLISFTEKISSVAFWVMCILAVFMPFALFGATPLYAFMLALLSVVALFLGYGVLLATFGIYNQLKMLNKHFNPQAFDGLKLLDYTQQDNNAHNNTLPKTENTTQSIQTEQMPVVEEKADMHSSIAEFSKTQDKQTSSFVAIGVIISLIAILVIYSYWATNA